MDVSPILNPLNDAQRAAVTAPEGATLVLAGAGSGKTRVLTHRVAWAVHTLGAAPHNILAVTFTNKAAGEMRHRIEALLGVPGGAMWVGTFHGIAHRFLRLHHQLVGLPPGFQILDSEDQQRLIKKIIRAQELDETRYVPREVQYYINKLKDDGIRPGQVKTGHDPIQQMLAKLYEVYEETCRRSGVVDFAELLLRAFELLRDNASLLGHYRARFKHVLVDEFQDTNTIQYAWTRLITGDGGNAFVVGDDDQSIYRWRGAKVENLHQFTRDYPDAQGKTSGPTAKKANRSNYLRPLTNEKKRTSSSSASANGHAWAVHAVKLPSCIVPTLNRAPSKKPFLPPAFRIGYMAAYVSTSGLKSKTPWPTCG
jgi:DNA helicase II / ATP-dependent DNA helicase PcrA